VARPQSPELRRSGRNPALEPDNVGTRLEAAGDLERSGTTGPVPDENLPGHHPDDEQDRPDLDAFVDRFGQAGQAVGGEPAGVGEDLGAGGEPDASVAAAAVVERATQLAVGEAASGRPAGARRVVGAAFELASRSLHFAGDLSDAVARRVIR
jgi:hypothetical protein